MPLHNKKIDENKGTVVFEVDLIGKSESDRGQVEFTQIKDGNIEARFSTTVPATGGIILNQAEFLKTLPNLGVSPADQALIKEELTLFQKSHSQQETKQEDLHDLLRAPLEKLVAPLKPSSQFIHNVKRLFEDHSSLRESFLKEQQPEQIAQVIYEERKYPGTKQKLIETQDYFEQLLKNSSKATLVLLKSSNLVLDWSSLNWKDLIAKHITEDAFKSEFLELKLPHLKKYQEEYREAKAAPAWTPRLDFQNAANKMPPKDPDMQQNIKKRNVLPR